MDGCERIDERPRGMFYRDTIVDTKCSYQNLKSWHVRIDLVEWDPELHTLALRLPVTRGGTCKTKDSYAQVRMCVRRVKQVML